MSRSFTVEMCAAVSMGHCYHSGRSVKATTGVIAVMCLVMLAKAAEDPQSLQQSGYPRPKKGLRSLLTEWSPPIRDQDVESKQKCPNSEFGKSCDKHSEYCDPDDPEKCLQCSSICPDSTGCSSYCPDNTLKGVPNESLGNSTPEPESVERVEPTPRRWFKLALTIAIVALIIFVTAGVIAFICYRNKLLPMCDTGRVDAEQPKDKDTGDDIKKDPEENSATFGIIDENANGKEAANQAIDDTSEQSTLLLPDPDQVQEGKSHAKGLENPSTCTNGRDEQLSLPAPASPNARRARTAGTEAHGDDRVPWQPPGRTYVFSDAGDDALAVDRQENTDAGHQDMHSVHVPLQEQQQRSSGSTEDSTSTMVPSSLESTPGNVLHNVQLES